ncbi:hypothetical protein [Paenibacillus larvae]|uniref:Uncharacterized protein n=1 Tax=Paenibacillus larvae subsp. larvae TaxID=147375 RepID=A0A2L1U7B8_9BACL|nr:hypothetical protein [Paenibacillus larvae]AVF28813.1 hypothetical protein ERICIII_04809 [Paenibacillus larvae subsp. larvae]MCY9499073.1 hypothetical protein [Paenibacillus larvae]MCY9745362.1 hypothetical protein [Paenibacillus larvae]MCY9750206.1 hypothetical protein [Paenibacillus larvae]MDR5608828.1 hypothetical protein [Paenibacillus larvae]
MRTQYWCEECQNFVEEHLVEDGIHDGCGQEVDIYEDEEFQLRDTVEIISTSNPEIHGKIATVLDIKAGIHGKDLRIRTDDGLVVWIDAEDVVLWGEVSK